MQEVCHARRITLCCSGFRESWETVYEGLYRVYDRSRTGLTVKYSLIHSRFRGTATWTLATLDHWSDWTQSEFESRYLGISTALRIFIDSQHSQCADARDKIFALASLSCIRGFPADYSSHWSTLYTNFVQWCMQFEPSENSDVTPSCEKVSSDFVSIAAWQALQRTCPTKDELALPSWVPDWRKEVDEVVWEPDLPHLEGPKIHGRTLSARLSVYGTLRPGGRDYRFRRKGLNLVDMNGCVHIERYDRALQPVCQDLRAGDVVCSPFVWVPGHGGIFALVLRENGRKTKIFRVVGLCSLPLPINDDIRSVPFFRLPCVVQHFDIV